VIVHADQDEIVHLHTPFPPAQWPRLQRLLRT
jgi:hypothetical protein